MRIESKSVFNKFERKTRTDVLTVGEAVGSVPRSVSLCTF
jgi:hypothetical protein